MDYLTLLQIKLPLKNFYLFLTILGIVSLSFFLNWEFYDTHNFNGIYDEGTIYIDVPIDYLDTLLNGEFLKIAQQKYSFKVLHLEPVKLAANGLYYQTVAIQVDKTFYNNEVISLVVYAQKEKVMQKIKKIF